MNMNNAYLDHPLDCNEYDMTSSMDLVAHSEGYEDIDGAMFGGFQDTMGCWDELVNLVNTPLESAWAF